MRCCSPVAARRTGTDAKAFLRRWRTDIGVVLAVRRARMARRCLPRPGAREHYILHGGADDSAEGWRRAAGGLAAYMAGPMSIPVQDDDAASVVAWEEPPSDLSTTFFESDDDF